MTAMELNVELFRQLSLIADDETLMRKAVKTIQRITKQREEAEYISKAEFFVGIASGLQEVRQAKDRSLHPKTARDFLNEL